MGFSLHLRHCGLSLPLISRGQKRINQKIARDNKQRKKNPKKLEDDFLSLSFSLIPFSGTKREDGEAAASWPSRPDHPRSPSRNDRKATPNLLASTLMHVSGGWLIWLWRSCSLVDESVFGGACLDSSTAKNSPSPYHSHLGLTFAQGTGN